MNEYHDAGVLTKAEPASTSERGQKCREPLHPAWTALIQHCRQLGFGTIEHLKIQDGLPVMAEESIKRTKFL